MHASLVACELEFPLPSNADRRRLTALARDRSAAQKHVCRAEIVLPSADGCRHQRDHAPNRQTTWRGKTFSTILKPIVGEHRWAGAVSFEAPRFSNGTRHALKRFSILASFCQSCDYKSCVSAVAISCCCNQSAVRVSHRRLEWQTFAGIALAVHSGPSPVIV
jgi:hypothetical protein